MRRRESGFTLLEAVVSLALSALFMLLAAQLLRDTQLATLATRRQALDPAPQHIAERMRRDVQRATGTLALRGRSGLPWSRGPLVLALPSGGSVRYEKSADSVTRKLVDSAGISSGERPLLQGVVSWRWVDLGSGLVEVEIGFRRERSGAALDRRVTVSRESIDTLRLRVAMRGAPGRSSW